MNKDLYGKHFKVDDDIVNNLNEYRGEESIANIINTKSISYSNAKRLKNRMENGEKDKLGGDKFYNWITQTLNSKRGAIASDKDAKMEAGLANSHIKTHNKNGLNHLNRPTKSHSSYNDDIKINESLKRINEIISKLI